MKIKLVSDAEMSDILKKRHDGRVSDEHAIYKLSDASNEALDNEFLYKNKAKITNDPEIEGLKHLSVVLDTRAVLELERGSVGVEQVQVHNFKVRDASVEFVGIDVVTKNIFATEYTSVLAPDNVKELLEKITVGSDENKKYAKLF